VNDQEVTDTITVTITEQDIHKFKRLDKILGHKIPSISRTLIKKLFLNGAVDWSDEYDAKNLKLDLKKSPPINSKIDIQIPPPVDCDAKPENIPLEILFQDEHLVVVNKPAGMVTHPAPGNYSGTLVNAILHHCPDLKGIGDTRRPGIVHRLDKGTSGVMVVAKSGPCHEGLISLFSTHNIIRKYEALVMGRKMPDSGTITSTIGRHPSNRLKMAANVPRGKNAITHYRVLAHYDTFTHLELTLETGRTHQIRVHLSSILHHPIICDSLYGNPEEHLKRLGAIFLPILKEYTHPLLHASTLGFVHPITGEDMLFHVSPPDTFKMTLATAQKASLGIK